MPGKEQTNYDDFAAPVGSVKYGAANAFGQSRKSRHGQGEGVSSSQGKEMRENAGG